MLFFFVQKPYVLPAFVTMVERALIITLLSRTHVIARLSIPAHTASQVRYYIL